MTSSNSTQHLSQSSQHQSTFFWNMEASARRAANADKKTPPYMHDFFCAPPIYALKDKWENYRTKRRERKGTRNKDTTKGTQTPQATTNGTTPSSATETQASTTVTSFDPDARFSPLVETQAPSVPEMHTHTELREMLETNLGAINRPSE